jgi:dTDP-4-dehydrorhamnose 3,5-epimerase
VLLDDVDRRAIYLAEGLGHCFVALSDDATVSYLVTDVYNPTREHGIDPLDPDLALEFPLPADEVLLSPKDTDAPTLAAAREGGLLPHYADVTGFYASLNGAS